MQMFGWMFVPSKNILPCNRLFPSAVPKNTYHIPYPSYTRHTQDPAFSRRSCQTQRYEKYSSNASNTLSKISLTFCHISKNMRFERSAYDDFSMTWRGALSKDDPCQFLTAKWKNFSPLPYNPNITLSLRMQLTFEKITQSVLFPIAIMPSISVGAIVWGLPGAPTSSGLAFIILITYSFAAQHSFYERSCLPFL